MITKTCTYCSTPFIGRPQSPNQQFCPLLACQKERRKRWRQQKMATDSDYRHNQSQAQRAWLDRNPDYWRQYRKTQHSKISISSIDQLSIKEPLSGPYHIQFLPNPRVAKSDSWIAQITPINSVCECKRNACKEIT